MRDRTRDQTRDRARDQTRDRARDQTRDRAHDRPRGRTPARTRKQRQDRTRDQAVDALRGLAILGVVLGHWLVTAFVLPGGADDLRVTSPLAEMPALAPISWVLQTLAVFFLVGGYSAAKGLRPDEPSGARLRRRLTRLARPLPVLLVAWIPALAALRLAGFTPDGLYALVKLVVSPLWFLCVYAVLTALAPAVAALWNRLGMWGAVLLTGATALIDAGRFALGAPGWIGWATILTGWLLPFYLGVAWAGGALRGRRAGFVLLTGGAAATALLIVRAGYPASMVGVPGAAISNLSPPTLAAVTFGLAQTGLALLLHGPLTRWTRRARNRRIVTAANRSAMTIFLWHQTAMMAVTIGAFVAAGTLPGLHTAPDQPVWLAERLPWLAVFATALAGLGALVHRFERPERPSPTPPTARPGTGLDAGSGTGLGTGSDAATTTCGSNPVRVSDVTGATH